MDQIPFQDLDVVILVTNSNCRRSHAETELEKRRQSCASAARKLGKAQLRDITLEELDGQQLHIHTHTHTQTATFYVKARSFVKHSVCVYSAGREQLNMVEYHRVRHVVTEIQRTVDAVQALRDRDYKRLGELMNESHKSLR